jgi:hypothetical protein
MQGLKQFFKICSHRYDTKLKLCCLHLILHHNLIFTPCVGLRVQSFFTFAVLQGYITGVAFDMVYQQMLKARFHWCNFYGKSRQWNLILTAQAYHTRLNYCRPGRGWSHRHRVWYGSTVPIWNGNSDILTDCVLCYEKDDWKLEMTQINKKENPPSVASVILHRNRLRCKILIASQWTCIVPCNAKVYVSCMAVRQLLD